MSPKRFSKNFEKRRLIWLSPKLFLDRKFLLKRLTWEVLLIRNKCRKLKWLIRLEVVR